MITSKQVKEIKKNIYHLKDSLWKSLYEVMSVDEIEIKNIEAITFDKANEIRKRLARLKPTVSHKFNILVSFFDNLLAHKGYFKQNCPKKSFLEKDIG